MIVLCNFRNIAYEDYKVGVPDKQEYKEVLNIDAIQYGGSNHVNKKKIIAEEGTFHGRPYHVKINVPPYGITVLRPIKKRKELNQNGKEENRRNATGGRSRNKA